jgi:hypothetical protein
VIQIDGNDGANREAPMFERGRIDHIGLRAASIDALDLIRDRLIARAATDGFVTDFGPIVSVFFRDPDGLEGEVCVTNPDARPASSIRPARPRRATTPNRDGSRGRRRGSP